MLGINYNIIFNIVEFRKYDVSIILVMTVIFMCRSYNPNISINATAHIRYCIENAYFCRNTPSLLNTYQ